VAGPAVEQARAIGEVFDGIGAPVVLVGADWRPIWTSRALPDLLGCSEEEIRRRDPRSFVAPASLAQLEAAYAAREAGRPVQGTLRIRVLHASGSEVPVELVASAVPGIPGGRLVILRNVSALEGHEIRIRAAHDELDTILANVPLSIVTMDARGTILRVNPATEHVFGWAPVALRGRPVAILAADIGEEEHAGFLERYFRRRDPPSAPGRVIDQTRRVMAKRRDGTVFPADLRVAEIPRAAGEPRFVGVLEDVTEREAAQVRLLRSQRAEALGNLAAGVAHEFNNLLMIVGGNAELLRAAPGSAESLDAIDVAVSRAGRLVRHLLDYTGHGAGEKTVVELAETIEEFLGMVRPALDADVPVEVHGCGGALWVRADVAQLEQVALNLLVNARDAIRDAAEREVGRRGCIRVRLLDLDSSTVGFEVEDDGCGMTDSVLAQACDPFFRTKSGGRGPGLGLSAASGIIESHGGRLDIESSPGVGTRVRVTLPRHATEQDPAPVEDPPVAFESEAGAVVLVVDDEEFIRTLLERALEMEGYRVLTAADGLEALECLESVEPDLILLDLNMPRMAGHELLDRLAQGANRPPVIVMSGYVQGDLDGVEASVEKPFSLPDMFGLIAHHVRRPRTR
jgi:PAS domain S-box-containing protein